MVHNNRISVHHLFIQQVLRPYYMLGTVLDAGYNGSAFVVLKV